MYRFNNTAMICIVGLLLLSACGGNLDGGTAHPHGPGGGGHPFGDHHAVEDVAAFPDPLPPHSLCTMI